MFERRRVFLLIWFWFFVISENLIREYFDCVTHGSDSRTVCRGLCFCRVLCVFSAAGLRIFYLARNHKDGNQRSGVSLALQIVF